MTKLHKNLGWLSKNALHMYDNHVCICPPQSFKKLESLSNNMIKMGVFC